MTTWTTPPTFVSDDPDADAATFNAIFRDDPLYLYENRFSDTLYGVSSLEAGASGNSTPAAWADIAGATVTLGGSGVYVIRGTARIQTAGTPGVWRHVLVRLVCDGVAQSGVIDLYCNDGNEISQSNWWRYEAAAASKVAKLQSYGTDTNTIFMTNSYIRAWQSHAP